MEQITISRAEYEALKIKVTTLNETIDRLNSYNSTFMTPEQASQEMGLSPVLVRDLIKRGYIPSLRIGRGEKTTKDFIRKFCNDYENYDLSDLDHPQKKQFY